MTSHTRRWFKDGKFIAPIINKLGIGFRALWLARVVEQRRAGVITAAHEDIFRQVVNYQADEGSLFPSLARIAQDAGYKVSTVQRALKRGKASGLIRWVHRLKRVGSAVEQASNSYTLLVPAAGVLPPAKPQKTSGGQGDRVSPNKISSSCFYPPQPDRPDALAALARVRERQEAALREAYARRRGGCMA